MDLKAVIEKAGFARGVIEVEMSKSFRPDFNCPLNNLSKFLSSVPADATISIVNEGMGDDTDYVIRAEWKIERFETDKEFTHRKQLYLVEYTKRYNAYVRLKSEFDGC